MSRSPTYAERPGIPSTPRAVEIGASLGLSARGISLGTSGISLGASGISSNASDSGSVSKALGPVVFH